MLGVSDDLPYRIAALCFLFDPSGRVLLLHRHRPPNQNLYSPVGGKLETGEGESPTACAIRECWEEVGVRLNAEDLHLAGVVSEKAFEGRGHWLMFLFEATIDAELPHDAFDEGTLAWHEPGEIDALSLPETDRQVIWPEFWKHRGGFFAAHIDCSTDPMRWTLEQSQPVGAG